MRSARRWLGVSGLASLAMLACATPAPLTKPTPAPPLSAAGTPAAAASAAPPRVPRDESSPEARRQQLQTLSDTEGGARLLDELSRAPDDKERAFAFTKQVFDFVTRLNDPGAADALARYAASKPHVYFETRAALALGALGDLRAVPYLSRRLRLDPLEAYGDVEWEQRLKRDDNERVKSARVLGDLAILHPEALAAIRAEAEGPLIAWSHSTPSPHSNALRALAHLESRTDLDAWRAWADPQAPLPREGQQPPLPEEWVTSVSALRWVGKLRDAGSRDALYASLTKRPADFDGTIEGMMQSQGAILGMTLRALAVGGADGLSEWGEPAAFAPLLRFIDDPKNNEPAKLNAAAALGWVGTDGDLKKLATRMLALPKAKSALALIYAEALQQRPIAGLVPILLPALHKARPVSLRLALARAIGRTGVDAASEKKLLALLANPDVGADAALALMLGGSPRAAIEAVKRTDGALQFLGENWYNNHSFVSDAALRDGAFFRSIENADAIGTLSVAGSPQTWASSLLGKQWQNVVYDNGPHSVTRTVLNRRLLTIARGPSAAQAALAVRAFALLNEPGMLLALSRETGPVGAAAKTQHAALLAELQENPPPRDFDYE